jgi:hypothetical protein
MTDHPEDRTAMKTLLNGLLVGEGQLVESVGDWADRLCDDDPAPLVSRFVNQLGDEWFDTLPPDAFCEQVTEQVRRRLSAWHPGWPHLWAHVLRVTGVAVALAEDENIDPALAYLMGMCHDVAKLDEYQTGIPHEETGADFARRALRGHLTPGQIESIRAAILKEEDGPLADILHDADKLDKIGAAGVVRRVSAHTHSSWLSTALWRVDDDAARFPRMHFDLGDDLAHSKRAFLAWFIPLAEEVSDGL